MIITGGPQDGGPKFYVYADHDGLHVQHARSHIVIPPEDIESFARIVVSFSTEKAAPEKAA